MNRETGRAFTDTDECLKGIGTFVYDTRAHAKAIEDVRGILQRYSGWTCDSVPPAGETEARESLLEPRVTA